MSERFELLYEGLNDIIEYQKGEKKLKANKVGLG